MDGAQTPSTISTRQRRIATMAKESPGLVFQNLAHNMDLDWLREAYRRTRKSGATGIDGQTAQEYEAHLEANLQGLHERMKTGRYFAPPVRRVHIPKGNGETRPIGIPTFEDKVAQRAVAMLLEAVYEQDFYDCSYGFRPGRSAHTALDAVWRQTMRRRGGWVLEVDIRKFFDTLDHQHLRDILHLRIRDKGVDRLIGKWLQAGVMEGLELHRPDQGTPQGGVISPLLANVYLHEVLDRWFHEVVKPRLAGDSCLIRYADDFVMMFQTETDARRVLEVLPKRFERFGLQIHPDKTRLLEFRPPSGPDGDEPDDPHAGRHFDLLGFRHFWGRSRKGAWIVKRKTASTRFARATKAIWAWCRLHRHKPIPWQRAALAKKLAGHNSYYGLTGNAPALGRFRTAVRYAWRYWLSRRSQKGHLSWHRFYRMLERNPLPPTRVVHSVYRPVAKA